jgi:hypothetical protein
MISHLMKACKNATLSVAFFYGRNFFKLVRSC